MHQTKFHLIIQGFHTLCRIKITVRPIKVIQASGPQHNVKNRQMNVPAQSRVSSIISNTCVRAHCDSLILGILCTLSITIIFMLHLITESKIALKLCKILEHAHTPLFTPVPIPHTYLTLIISHPTPLSNIPPPKSYHDLPLAISCTPNYPSSPDTLLSHMPPHTHACTHAHSLSLSLSHSLTM